jgi:hypothetical protein
MGCGGSSEHTKVFFEYTAVVESNKFSMTLRPQLADSRLTQRNLNVHGRRPVERPLQRAFGAQF